MTRFLFCAWQLRVSWCVAPSLTRRRVCNLLVQFLLGLARAVTQSCRTHYHILLYYMRLPQPGRPDPRIYIPQEQGGPVIPPDTVYTFRRLLRLAGPRWSYSNSLILGIPLLAYITGRLTVGRKSTSTSTSTSRKHNTSPMCNQELWPLDHRGGSTFFCITYINSVRTSQEAQYISVL
jgi:hypothetical protein